MLELVSLGYTLNPKPQITLGQPEIVINGFWGLRCVGFGVVRCLSRASKLAERTLALGF